MFDKLNPITTAILRIGAGLLFMEHGAQKLLGWFGGLPPGMVVKPMTQIWFAGVLELCGGALMVLGLGTRAVAFLLAGEMLVAYFQVHMPQGGAPIKNLGELALLYMVVWLFFLGNGAGEFSLDAIIGRRRRPPRPVAAV